MKILHTIFTDYTHFSISNILYQYKGEKNATLSKQLDIVEREKIDTHNIHIHDHLISWLGKLIKSGRFKVILWAKAPYSEMLLLCKDKFRHTIHYSYTSL